MSVLIIFDGLVFWYFFPCSSLYAIFSDLRFFSSGPVHRLLLSFLLCLDRLLSFFIFFFVVSFLSESSLCLFLSFVVVLLFNIVLLHIVEIFQRLIVFWKLFILSNSKYIWSHSSISFRSRVDIVIEEHFVRNRMNVRAAIFIMTKDSTPTSDRRPAARIFNSIWSIASPDFWTAAIASRLIFFITKKSNSVNFLQQEIPNLSWKLIRPSWSPSWPIKIRHISRRSFLILENKSERYRASTKNFLLWFPVAFSSVLFWAHYVFYVIYW